jgi:hypothetical protein
MSTQNNWYVYKHIRMDSNEVFYIGIGNKKNFERAYEFRKDKRNPIWWKIYNKTNILVEIVFEGLSKENASTKEQELIKKYGRIDLNEGTLCNLTDGGDGIWNCKRSEETKKILSILKLGDKNPMYGKKQSDETKKKRSQSLTGQKRGEDTKKKQSLSSVSSGQAKSVNVYKYENGEYVGTYYAISEACRVLGFHHLNGKAVQVAKGKRKQTKGYVFKYVN